MAMVYEMNINKRCAHTHIVFFSRILTVQGKEEINGRPGGRGVSREEYQSLLLLL